MYIYIYFLKKHETKHRTVAKSNVEKGVARRKAQVATVVIAGRLIHVHQF